MTDLFWPLCTQVLVTYRSHPLDSVQQLLSQAEAAAPRSALDDATIKKRIQYLDRLRRHIDKSCAADANTISCQPASETIPYAAEAQAIPANEVRKLLGRISILEVEKAEMAEQLCRMPTIDPLCLSDPTFTWPEEQKEEFGIIVFGHTRLVELESVLESLKRQDALKYTEVWLDGYQGNHKLKKKIEEVINVVKKYPVKRLHTQNGSYGFRKMLLLSLIDMCKRYRDILILEDDCFPTRDAVAEFRKELDAMRDNERIFSVYGHHFLTDSEMETCARFQGWGWATTSNKLMPVLRQLIDCYSMSEEHYLKFVGRVLTPAMKQTIDVTPPRQPSQTLEKFFAWDETLCLLTALNKQVHKPTEKQTIFNCGMGENSTHFPDAERFRLPPFNLIKPDEVWQHF